MAPLTPTAFRLHALPRGPFRGTQPYPDPPTLEQYKAAPMVGTERVLKAAFAAKRLNEDHSMYKRKKIGDVPWLLDVSFDSDEKLWCFLDEMDDKELRRQRSKYQVKQAKDDLELKKLLFLFVKHQAYHAEEAERMMEKRILNANRKAEYREADRRRRRAKEEQKVKYASRPVRTDPFELVDAWIPQYEMIDIEERQ